MRIAHLGSKGLPCTGGTERVVEALATRQAEHHEVTVYGSRRVCRSGRLGGVRVLALPAPHGPHAGPVVLQVLCAAHALAAGRYDVVHLHGAENAFVLPLLRLRYPVVTTNHGPAYEREKWGPVAQWLIRSVEGLSVHCASAATAVAANQAKRLSRRYGLPVAAISNGVEPAEPADTAAATALLERLHLDPHGYWLFAAGRLDPTKGCHTLLQAHRSLGGGTPLLIVGDVDQAGAYGAELRRLAADDRVRFVPLIEDKSLLLGLLALARLFVFPSTVEAMSMMLLEALSLGVPTVASAIPENLGVLPPGSPVFRPGDPEDLARCLREVEALAPAERERRAGAARAWVVEHYRWDDIALAYERVYAGVLAPPAPRA